MRPLSGYFFEDYRVGQTFVHATPRTITSGDVALYIGLTGARHGAHCASTVAQAMGYPSAPIDDLLVFHIAFGKTVPDISWNAVANLGYADTRFMAPVYADDTLRCESEIIGLKQNSSGKTGVVYVRSAAFNQHNAMVLTWARWVMVLKRDIDLTSVPDTVLPMLPKSVTTESMVVPAFLQPRGLTSTVTGSTRFWDDYRVNEVINHPAGMTIDETDHTLATKLYQNTARVHFDLHHMKDSRFGRRLVYGGHVISVCRALSFDGLENVISIAAINSGSHINPAFAGDTLYAKSVIVEKVELRPDLGVLRVRLLGIKNATPAEIDATNPQLPENVVLDLDYSVFVPRQ